MTLQGPHQVAKQSSTISLPFSPMAWSKSALLQGKDYVSRLSLNQGRSAKILLGRARNDFGRISFEDVGGDRLTT